MTYFTGEQSKLNYLDIVKRIEAEEKRMRKITAIILQSNGDKIQSAQIYDEMASELSLGMDEIKSLNTLVSIYKQARKERFVKHFIRSFDETILIEEAYEYKFGSHFKNRFGIMEVEPRDGQFRVLIECDHYRFKIITSENTNVLIKLQTTLVNFEKSLVKLEDSMSWKTFSERLDGLFDVGQVTLRHMRRFDVGMKSLGYLNTYSAAMWKETDYKMRPNSSFENKVLPYGQWTYTSKPLNINFQNYKVKTSLVGEDSGLREEIVLKFPMLNRGTTLDVSFTKEFEADNHSLFLENRPFTETPLYKELKEKQMFKKWQDQLQIMQARPFLKQKQGFPDLIKGNHVLVGDSK